MSKEQILTSNNPKLFELLSFNRDVNKVKKLTASMTKHGWISAYPMNVVMNGNGKFKIKDGHHRFEIACRLGIPFKYVICDDKSTIYELDGATNKWSTIDTLVSYCRDGKIEYLKLKEYCDETGINLTNATSMLHGETAGSYNRGEEFRTGKFKINQNSNHAGIVKELVLTCKKHGVSFYNTDLLVKAFSRIAWVDKFNLDHMKTKIKYFATFIEKKANLDQYLTMLEEIYNRKSQSKIPLKYLAMEKAKERRAVKYN